MAKVGLFLRGLSILIGILTLFISSVEWTFNVYANSLKVRLNFSQSEVELSASFLTIGATMSLPCGALYVKVGARGNFTIGALLALTGFGVLWLATILPRVFSSLSGLVAVLHYLGGQGLQFLRFTAIVVNAKNVSPTHRGKVITIHMMSFYLGVMLIALIYNQTIEHSGGLLVPPLEQNLNWFLFCILIAIVILYCLQMSLLRPYGHAADYRNLGEHSHLESTRSLDFLIDSTGSTVVCSLQNGNSKSNVTPDSPARSFAKLFGTINFQLALWSFVSATAVTLLFCSNSTTFAHSLRLDDKTQFFTVTAVLIELLLVFAASALIDFLYSKYAVRQSVFVFLVSCMLLASQLVLLTPVAPTFEALAAVDVTALFVGSLIYPVRASMLSIQLKAYDFSMVWAFHVALSGLGALGLMKTFGALYDANIDTAVTTECLGIQCLTSTAIVTSSVSCLGCVCALVLVVRGE